MEIRAHAIIAIDVHRDRFVGGRTVLWRCSRKRISTHIVHNAEMPTLEPSYEDGIAHFRRGRGCFDGRERSVLEV